METRPRIRLWLVDDHALFRERLARLLGAASGFEMAAQPASVDEALHALGSQAIDVVVLDLDLGQQRGSELLSVARATGFEGPLLIDRKHLAALHEAPAPGAKRWSLTERERVVLRGVFEGLANKEIAARLSISESSVKAALQQLFHKTGVRTRSQLVRIALDRYRDLVGSGSTELARDRPTGIPAASRKAKPRRHAGPGR